MTGTLIFLAPWKRTGISHGPQPNHGMVLQANKEIDSADGVCSETDCSLREAIIAANAIPGHDTIMLPAGNYVLGLTGESEDAAATGDLDITDDLTLAGDGQSTTVIDANSIDRVFHTFPGIIVEFSGVTIRGGAQFNAGGIAIDASVVTFSDSTITGNAQDLVITSSSLLGGGGIHTVDGTVNLINTIVSNNRSAALTGGGGGIHMRGPLAKVTLTDSTVTGNTSSSAGGIFIDEGGTLLLRNSSVSGNVAERYGGIWSFDGLISTVDSHVDSNTSTESSSGIGGIIAQDTDLTMKSSTVDNNTGLGIMFLQGRFLTLENSSVSGNTGGGIHASGGVGIMKPPISLEVTIEGSSILNNHGISGGVNLNFGNNTLIYSEFLSKSTIRSLAGTPVSSAGSHTQPVLHWSIVCRIH